MDSSRDVTRIATTFTVQDLVTRAWRGDIRIPHFQRAFRWKRTDAERLFDSIVKNYPIGSLLLWARPGPETELTLGALRVAAPETEEALWVVDGQQRITSLANALHPDGLADPHFSLAYHLRGGTFVKPRHDRWEVPLPVLFEPEQLMQWFWDRPELKDYFQAASTVMQKLRDYSMPAYLVEHEDERVLQDIFDRMNTYGKRLTKAEVFNALNAGDEETAPDQLTFARIGTHIDEARQFGEIDEGTVMQAVLARRHPDVQREIRNEFGRHDGEGRDVAYQAAEEALLRAVSFLQDDAGVPHVTFLPYSYLLVVLVRFFAHFPEPDEENRALLRRWFWRAAVVGSGVFAGGHTGATRILGQQIAEGDEDGSVRGMLQVLGEKPNDFAAPDVRKFRTTTAGTCTLLCSWWAAGPRDPETGEPFKRADLAERLQGQSTSSDAIHTVISPGRLPDAVRSSAANRVLLPAPRRNTKEILDLLTGNLAELDSDLWEKVQRSHFVTPRLADLLSWGDDAQFVTVRQKMMHDNVSDFLQEHCGWGFDTPAPFSGMILDDVAS